MDTAPRIPQALRAALVRLAVESDTAGHTLAHALLSTELHPEALGPVVSALIALASAALDSSDRDIRDRSTEFPARAANAAGTARECAVVLDHASQVARLMAESLTELAGIYADATGNDGGRPDPIDAPDSDPDGPVGPMLRAGFGTCPNAPHDPSEGAY